MSSHAFLASLAPSLECPTDHKGPTSHFEDSVVFKKLTSAGKQNNHAQSSFETY